MTDRFKGRVALVTGAASGIGRATALAFAREGAQVVVSDVDGDRGERVVHEVSQAGGQARFVRADVANARDVEALVAATVAAYGHLDVAFNNAGIGGAIGPVGDYPEDAWSRVLAVNLTGVFSCMKHEIRQMLAQGTGGAIVNNASILGLVGFSGSPAYVAAKHGVLGLTKTAALDYAARGIRVNAVCPAFVDTPLLAQAGLTTDPTALAALAGLHPMQRLGRPDEVAAAVLFLAHESSSFVTGHPLLVDGGYVAR